jgi:hypothetical protein
LAANTGDIVRNDHSANALADFSCHASKRRGDSANLAMLAFEAKED